MSLAFSVACLCGSVVYDVIVGAEVITLLALFYNIMYGGHLCPECMLVIVSHRLTALLWWDRRGRGLGVGGWFSTLFTYKLLLCVHTHTRLIVKVGAYRNDQKQHGAE